MPSRFDTQQATDWTRAFDEFKEEVIRRIGGDAHKTQPVQAIVDLDGSGATGRLVADLTGERFEADGFLELSLDQEVHERDTWVVRGAVYRTVGLPESQDGGSKTLGITKRTDRTRKQPRVNRG